MKFPAPYGSVLKKKSPIIFAIFGTSPKKVIAYISSDYDTLQEVWLNLMKDVEGVVLKIIESEILQKCTE